MSDLRILGVAVQLLVAVLLIGVGALAVSGRARASRAWDVGWGRTPRRTDGAALALLGLGVAAWALTQTADLVALSLQLTAIGIVVLGALAVLAVQITVHDDDTADADEVAGTQP